MRRSESPGDRSRGWGGPALLLLALVLTGCGGTGAAPAPSPPTPSSTAPSPTAPSPTAPSPTAPSPTAPSPTAPATSAPDPGGVTVTVVGVVRSGALPRCAVLTADDGRRFVLDGAPEPPLGVPVTVRGVVDPGVASFCNAGVTLRVQDLAVR